METTPVRKPYIFSGSRSKFLSGRWGGGTEEEHADERTKFGGGHTWDFYLISQKLLRMFL